MISFLSSWVKNLSLALIIVSILEMILPNNKTKKYVKMVMGLYILFSIIAPFIENSDKFDFNKINLDSYDKDIQTTYSLEEVNQTSMDKRLKQMYEEELEKDILQKIRENGYEAEKCNVTAQISKNDSKIEKIVLIIKGKIEQEEENSGKSEETIESKIVTEIQKIQKVEINVSENGEKNPNNKESNEKSEKETSNITKTDIKIIKDFLIKEYGVSEQCLKIS